MAVVEGSEGLSCFSCIEKDRKVEFLLDTLSAVVKPTKISESLIPELVEWLASDTHYAVEGDHLNEVILSLREAYWYFPNFTERVLTAALNAFNERKADDTQG